MMCAAADITKKKKTKTKKKTSKKQKNKTRKPQNPNKQKSRRKHLPPNKLDLFEDTKNQGLITIGNSSFLYFFHIETLKMIGFNNGDCLDYVHSFHVQKKKTP